MEACKAEHILKHLEKPSRKPNWKKDFPSVGEGTIIFNVLRTTPFCIVIRPDIIPECPDEWISLEIDKNCVEFKIFIDGKVTTLAKRCGETERKESVGYEEGRKISYWFSYDRSLLTLKYGKGYRMTETTILEYSFIKDMKPDEQSKERKHLKYLFSPEYKRVIEQYDMEEKNELVRLYENKLMKGMTYGYDGSLRIAPLLMSAIGADSAISKAAVEGKLQEEAKSVATSLIDMEGKVDFVKHPFICNWSPFVLDSSKNTLFELDSNNFTFSASLPQACQELYRNVVQEGIYLDWPPGLDQYKLTDAIRYSLECEDGVLHKKIKDKENEFGNPEKTYLRITLGMDRGNSPGIPYVLEIWPKQHGSPIHNHGNAYAVIKVLHGGLTIHVYNKHTDSETERELLRFNVKEGDVTWISPNWYQTHKLWNTTDDYCATIQCYQYGENDNLHWPYFDYVKSSKIIDEFLPNSDFTFREMREKVLKEYIEHKRKESEKMATKS